MYLFQVGSKVIALFWGTGRTLLHDHNSSNKRGVDVPTQQLVTAVELNSQLHWSCAANMSTVVHSMDIQTVLCMTQPKSPAWNRVWWYYFNCSIAQLHNTFKLYEIQLPVTEGHCHLLLLDVLARPKTAAGLSSGEFTQMTSSLKLTVDTLQTISNLKTTMFLSWLSNHCWPPAGKLIMRGVSGNVGGYSKQQGGHFFLVWGIWYVLHS